jgi:cell wall-associated NlpC family hydrolase
MAILSAEEIYRYAVMAGFTPDQAVTMTAIALAESSGNSGAHNPNGEDSKGLWQINMDSHPEFDGWDLYDPLTNAKAAYSVSMSGQDISPWTTAHFDDAPYLQYRDEAQAAAAANGDTGAVGNWSPSEGYGHPAPAAGSGGSGTTSQVDTSAAVQTVDAGLPQHNGNLDTFLNAAEAQVGDPYVWGVGADINDANPDAFDCSELTRWAAGRAGYDLSDGTWLQYLQLKDAGMLIPVDEAINTPGALLFRFSEEPQPGAGRPDSAHVAISMGDGRTVEASDPSVGVIYGDADNNFNFAAVLPGISDGSGGGFDPSAAGAAAAAPAGVLAVDTDADGITDDMEAQLGLDPNNPDSDADGLTDGYEMLHTKTNALLADSDRDGLSDSVEINTGSDALNPDSNRDGMADGETGPIVDADRDGLSDALETILGTSPTSPDFDGDGFTDGAEYLAGFDPLKAESSPLAQLGVGADPGLDLDLST